jgi:transcriptional regulator with XRE-family HTH domain
LTLGDRLKAVRKAQTPKLSQAAFAKTIGLTRDAYGVYEIDRVVPSDAVIKLICVTYKINPRWLETGEGDMEISDREINVEQEIRTIMRGADEFAVDIMTKLASMPPEVWALWREAFEREKTKK